MYLSENKILRLVTLCALYVAQGIPFGFVTVTFASWLARPEHHLTTEQIGPILGVATLPWSFKFLWGPIMDRWTLPSMGRRRPWILLAQGLAICVLSSMLFFEDLPRMVWTSPEAAHPLLRWIYELVPGPLAALILLANIFVSMQDVAVDALAVDLLEEHERGVANGLMYGCSYLGTAIGGAGLGWVVARYGIRAGLLAQAGLLCCIMLLPLLVKERRFGSSTNVLPPGKSDNPLPDTANEGSDRHAVAKADHAAPSAPDVLPKAPDLKDLVRAFTLRATALGAFVAVGIKIGIGALTAVLVNYLMKDAGWSQQQYTAVTGGWAVMCGLTGAAAGGFIADRFGPKPVITAISVALGLLWCSIGLIPETLTSRTIMTGVLISQEFLFAVLSVALFSMFMTLSWPRVAATQFTAYMALMNLSTTIGSYLAGELSARLTVPGILIAAGVLQALLVLPVLPIDIHQARRELGDA